MGEGILLILFLLTLSLTHKMNINPQILLKVTIREDARNFHFQDNFKTKKKLKVTIRDGSLFHFRDESRLHRSAKLVVTGETQSRANKPSVAWLQGGDVDGKNSLCFVITNIRDSN
jgi:hypothetical protein